jgi:CheY-like chemotaxis protein
VAQLKSIPVVFLTASVSKDQPRFHHPLLEINTILIKPVGAEDLMDCINRILKPGIKK